MDNSNSSILLNQPCRIPCEKHTGCTQQWLGVYVVFSQIIQIVPQIVVVPHDVVVSPYGA